MLATVLKAYNDLWDIRDRRLDGYFLADSLTVNIFLVCLRSLNDISTSMFFCSIFGGLTRWLTASPTLKHLLPEGERRKGTVNGEAGALAVSAFQPRGRRGVEGSVAATLTEKPAAGGARAVG